MGEVVNVQREATALLADEIMKITSRNQSLPRGDNPAFASVKTVITQGIQLAFSKEIGISDIALRAALLMLCMSSAPFCRSRKGIFMAEVEESLFPPVPSEEILPSEMA